MNTRSNIVLIGFPRASRSAAHEEVERSLRALLAERGHELAHVTTTVSQQPSESRSTQCRIMALCVRGEALIVAESRDTVKAAVDAAAERLARTLERRADSVPLALRLRDIWRRLHRRRSTPPRA